MYKSYYAIIPADVRYDKDLTPNAKLLYGEITALANEKGYCWASNVYFAEIYGVSKVSISKWISQLVEKGYIHTKIFYKENSKEIESRHIYLGATPIKEKFNTPKTEVGEGHKEKFNTPIKEKFKDNNTSFNTTFNNTLEQQHTANECNESKKPVVGIDKSFGELVKFYEQNIGQITPAISDELGIMTDDLNAELALLALKESVIANAKVKIRYAQSILKSWKSQNYRTVADVENAENRRKARGRDVSNQTDNESDYDYGF